MVLGQKISARHVQLVVIACCLALLAAFCTTVGADDYGVGAVVPYPAPIQAAVINQPADTTTVAAALQTVAGSCELLSPEGTVSIWRGGISIGSTVCDGGFSLPVMLQAGSNVLVARSASASGLYGPDSAPLTITLNLPPNSGATQSPALPTNHTPTPNETNAAIATGLTATVSAPFSTLTSSNMVTISVSVGGGTPPYSIAFNWGDGSTETHSVSNPGIYKFSHTYIVTASYIIHGQVQDVKGAVTAFSYAVVTTQKPLSNNRLNPSKTTPQNSHLSRNILWVSIGTGFILILVSDYRLGWHRATKRFAAAKKSRKRKLARRRKKTNVKKTKR